MDLNDFDYDLPAERIAQHPRPERGQSRLLVLHRDGSGIEHRTFSDLSQYMQAGDCLVINETKVLPARLVGTREGSGGKMELLLVRELDEGRWQFLIKPARKARVGRRLIGKVAAHDVNRAVVWAQELVSNQVAEEYAIGPATLEDIYLGLVGRQDALDAPQNILDASQEDLDGPVEELNHDLQAQLVS